MPDGTGFCRPDSLPRHDRNRMYGGVDVAAPIIQEFMQFRIARREIVELPDEALNKDGMVRHIVKDFRRRQPVSLQLHREIFHRSHTPC